jgi:hypothetical protein
MAEVETAFEASDLPKTVNTASALAALVSVRESIYGQMARGRLKMGTARFIVDGL